MPERIRSVKVYLEVDTNKETYRQELVDPSHEEIIDALEDLREWAVS